MSPNDILQYLQLDNKNIFNVKIENQEKIKYQEKILLQVFPVENQLSIFENLEISLFNYSRLALVNLLEYCLVNQKNLLTNIKKPIKKILGEQKLLLKNIKSLAH